MLTEKETAITEAASGEELFSQLLAKKDFKPKDGSEVPAIPNFVQYAERDLSITEIARQDEVYRREQLRMYGTSVLAGMADRERQAMFAARMYGNPFTSFSPAICLICDGRDPTCPMRNP